VRHRAPALPPVFAEVAVSGVICGGRKHQLDRRVRLLRQSVSASSASRTRPIIFPVAGLNRSKSSVPCGVTNSPSMLRARPDGRGSCREMLRE
jgi:hypothetical protein